MRSCRPRLILCSVALFSLPAFFAGSAVAAGKAAKGAAKSKPAPSSAASDEAATKKDGASEPSESPASAPPPPASSPGAASSDALWPTPASGGPAQVEAPATPLLQAVAPPLPPAAEEPKPASGSMPIWVEHLGPESYPGKLRGLYGGSMWLEPSFHGLQWPYMAKSGLGLSGSFWVDTGYERVTREHQRLGDTVMWLQQGRGVLRVTPTFTTGRFFIQGQVELVGNQCQQSGGTTSSCQTFGTFDTDDLWIRVGHWNLWDIKLGRYEAWELYHTGMGLDINTLERQGATMGPIVPGNIAAAPAFYAVNYLHDRPSAGLGVGYGAIHVYPTDFLRLELLSELGTDDSTGAGYVYRGGRPAAIIDLGIFKAKVGAEYELQTLSTQQYDASTQQKKDPPYKRTKKGVGGGLQFVIDPWIEFGMNGAYGSQAQTDINGNPKGQGTFTTTSMGGFVNAQPFRLFLVGVGVNWTTQTDSNYVNGSLYPSKSNHLQTFLTAQYLLLGQLYIRAVFGWARSDFNDSDRAIPIWSNYMYSGRLRLMYLY